MDFAHAVFRLPGDTLSPGSRNFVCLYLTIYSLCRQRMFYAAECEW